MMSLLYAILTEKGDRKAKDDHVNTNNDRLAVCGQRIKSTSGSGWLASARRRRGVSGTYRVRPKMEAIPPRMVMVATAKLTMRLLGKPGLAHDSFIHEVAPQDDLQDVGELHCEDG